MNEANRNGMPRADSMRVLNRLLAAFQYSLASYLGYAHPWTHAGNASLLDAVRQITADHEAHVQRIGGLILERRGTPETGRFPTRFTSYNDLALDYLARWLVEDERKLIDEVARSVAGLRGDPDASQLIEAVFAVEKRHLGTLSELTETARFHSEGIGKGTSPADINSDMVSLVGGPAAARVQRP